MSYLLAFDAACVFVAISSEGYLIQSARNPAVAAGKARASIKWLAWAKVSDINLVMEHVNISLRRGKPICERDCFEIVDRARRAVNVELRDHDRVLAKTTDRVLTTQERFEFAKSTGRMKFFNTAYRKYRLAEKAAGRRAVGYPAAVSRLKRVLLSRGSSQIIDRTVLDEVFNPDLK